MARSYHLARRPRRSGLDRYLLDGERIVTASHHHWARIAVPVISVAVGLIVVLLLDSAMPAGLSLLANLLWWGWFALIGWAVWELLKWRHDWFVATDKRLILTYGLVTAKVGMMPLTKVTDMSYTRSPMGRVLGYGTFVMESAGLDQALRKVRWVDNPDHTYRVICAEIFGVEDREVAADSDEHEHDHRFEDGPPPHTPGLYAEYTPAAGRPGATDSPKEPAAPDEAPDLPIRYAAPPRGDRDRWYQSPDLRDPALREPVIRDADTGPIPYRRPATDDGDGWQTTTNDPDRARERDRDRKDQHGGHDR
jgi:membrane protein YdbS with pleckstrin-like domain